jgi:hypothetical protein
LTSVHTYHGVAALLPGLAADEAGEGQLLVVRVRLLCCLFPLVRVPALRRTQGLGLLLRLPLLRTINTIATIQIVNDRS